ncbi:MAG: hypothetical protein ACOX6U_00830 [Oscillospiraceae bacterium]|jgi:hypothetical protein
MLKKVRRIVIVVVITALIAGMAIAIPLSEAPQTHRPPEAVTTSDVLEGTIPLPRLVEYYEGQLDPAIPKIEVAVEVTEYGETTTYSLPYDALLRTGEQPTEMDQNRTWFLNLLNHYPSLPQLCPEGLTRPPAHFTIRFSEQPDSPITIIDYCISDKDGTAGELTGSVLSTSYIGDATRIFEIDTNELGFDLWYSREIALRSDAPHFRGFQLKCSYDGQPVEYYILFQTIENPPGDYSRVRIFDVNPLEE